jgi:hypothetical protein
MSSFDDGGEFEHLHVFTTEGRRRVPSGLTKREWFAGQALAGYMTREHAVAAPEDVAKLMCRFADALIAELAK